MISEKAISMATKHLLSDGDSGSPKIVMIFFGIIMIPIIVVMVVFGGNMDGNDTDPYRVVFNDLNCDKIYEYQLDVIRLLDTYIAEEKDESFMNDKVGIKKRMENDYFHISDQVKNNGKKKCILYTDEELLDILINTYKVPKKYKSEILDEIKQIRNGRENFILPINGTVLRKHDDQQSGIVIESSEKDKVVAAASGKVVKIYNSNKEYEVNNVSTIEELSVLIEHEVKNTINANGEYDINKMYTYYTNMTGLKVKEGEEVEQGKNIGSLATKKMHFEIRSENDSVDPFDYIYDPTEDVTDYIELLNQDVLKYREYILKSMDKAGLDKKYLKAIMVIMQIESGGKGSDPMQSSECPENHQYPNLPGAITDPLYSIDVGVKYFRNCIKDANVKDESDIEHLQLAVQGYNYGNGYIPWAQLRGGYSAENAMQFSRELAHRLGWNSYGDPNYAIKFLHLYQQTASEDAGNLRFIYPMKTYVEISAGYGFYDPFGTGSVMHWGTDFPAPMGTPYMACEAGEITYAGYNENGGLMIMIKHNDTYTTLYDHSSRLNVKVGDHVQKGQIIGYVGTTGNVTGPHVHLELRKTVNGNTKRINIVPYLNKNS